MLHNTTLKLTYRALLKPTAIAGMLIGFSGTAFADHTYHTDTVSPDPTSYEFRASHPFKVYVDVNLEGESARERNRRSRHNRDTDTNTDKYARDRIAYKLPSYVVLVSNRRSADMVIRANELDYQLSFSITDVDQRNKKYKKRYRYTGGKCGLHQRAFYTRITEKGEAHAGYQLLVNLKGAGQYKDTVSIKAAEKFRRGENLRAQTNCGIQPTVHFPNSAVAKLFARSNEGQRQSVAFEIRKETTKKLANVIASNIRARSEQYYANLAAYYTEAPAYYDTHYERKRVRADIYDHDDDAEYPRYR